MGSRCEQAWTIDCLHEYLLCPVVQALAFDLGQGSCTSMNLRRNSNDYSPGMGRLRCSAKSLGHDKVAIDRFFKGSDQLVDALAVKSDHIRNPCQTPEKDPILCVELYPCSISLVSESSCHGSIPTDSRNSRMART